MAPHYEEPVEVVINDEVFYQADMMILARPESGVDMRQGPSGPGAKSDDEGRKKDSNKENQGEDDPMEGKGKKVS